jgi:hypothetical protein
MLERVEERRVDRSCRAAAAKRRPITQACRFAFSRAATMASSALSTTTSS